MVKSCIALVLVWKVVLADALAQDILLTLHADPYITPSQKELVTFGLPLAPGILTDPSQLHIYQDGQPLARAARAGLLWHWRDQSIRSLIIQLHQMDMTQGAVQLTLTIKASPVAADLIVEEQPHSLGWAKADPINSGIFHPRVYALHSPDYLATTALIPPYAPISGHTHLTEFLSGQFSHWAGSLNYQESRAADWLFDRPSAFFKAYMASGELRYLREAFLSKQFYFQYVRNDGSLPSRGGGSGCWTFKTVSCADGKYIYAQPAKLALALSGDDSQWDPPLIVNMALQADLGNHQPNTRQRIYRENQPFTERAAGLVGLTEVHAFEITGEERLLYHFNERLDHLYAMQNETTRWERFNNWLPKSGAFVHAWSVHEGHEREAQAATGQTDNRRFSPWMSENIADFLWHSFQITQDERIPGMLKRLGDAIDRYGFRSRYLSGEQLEAQYEARFDAQGRRACTGASDLATDLLYSASPFASDKAMIAAHEQYHWTDKHNIQIILPLALAYHFSEDTSDRKRLAARISHIQAQWTQNESQNCAGVFGNTYRMWNWQHRSNSLATWLWVQNH
ncbi:hypothetical protein ABC502_06695 [Alkalimonas sp. NCh-2]|uniref:hypothetical protein n=1 Tax=Alkalimonas sp. NCh-2 TaxID=3144846 RepID=UPI0031F62C9D